MGWDERGRRDEPIDERGFTQKRRRVHDLYPDDVVEDVAGGRAAPCRAMATLGMSEAVRSPARGRLSRSGARRWLTSVGAMTGGAMLLAHAIVAHQRGGMIGSRASRGGTGGTHGGVLDLVPQRGGTSGTSLFARPVGTSSQPP